MAPRLLWIDDEIDMLRPHILFLEKKGYDVAMCNNGSDALRRCSSEPFDLILLDENMPGLSGLETLEGIKELQPDVPVVMVTKNEEEDLMDQAIGAQIADYLIKPVNPNQILLTLKKNIHQREIVSEATQSGYSRAFAELQMRISDNPDFEQWKELYRSLVRWELQLSESAAPMADMLATQKEEANAHFFRFVKQNYEQWVAHPDNRPLMSPDVMKRAVFPVLNEGRKVYVLVLDNFRYDQWRVLSPELADDFDIDEDLYLSILPTATGYARNAIFAGLMPADIQKMYPNLWVEETDEEGKNLHEKELIYEQLQRFRRKERFTYNKFNDSVAVERMIGQIATMPDVPLNVLVVNFIDILSHARTESRMVRELARDEAAYRSITRSWFRHTAVKELFSVLADQNADIFITTDHGSIFVDTPIRVQGDREVNTNLRYKLGRNLSYPSREVFEMKRPQQFGLPAPNLTSTYIYAAGRHFFAYPNNYNHYVQYYKGTFQHGGISMEEMLVPLVHLRPKRSR